MYCDLCGMNFPEEKLDAVAEQRLLKKVRLGFASSFLDLKKEGQSSKVINQGSTAVSKGQKWNADFQDWMLCKLCQTNLGDWERIHAGGTTFVVAGLIICVFDIFFGLKRIDQLSRSDAIAVYILLGLGVLIVIMGIIMRRYRPRFRTMQDELESLRKVQVTPELIAYAQQELQKEIPDLLNRIKDTDPSRRAKAAAILGTAGLASPEVVRALTESLQDSDGSVFVYAAVSLDSLLPKWYQKIDGQTLATKLAAAVVDNKISLDHKIRIAAAKVVQKLDPIRGEALLMITQFEKDIDSGLAANLGVTEKDLQQVDMKDKLIMALTPTTAEQRKPGETVWVAKNPRLATSRPIADLKRIFLFTTGDGKTILNSSVMAGMLEDSLGAPLDDIRRRLEIIVFAHSDAAAMTAAMGELPQDASQAIAVVDPEVIPKTQDGSYFAALRVFREPQTNEHCVFVLIYQSH
ncbi:hypothetical protein L0156_28065 [bacterium]|nr:hypothetical protein [bacterium]